MVKINLKYYLHKFWVLLILISLAFSTINCVKRIGSQSRKDFKNAQKRRNNFYKGKDPYRKK